MNSNGTNQNTNNGKVQEGKPKKLGPCCVCKETKKIRDECFLFKNE